MRAPSHLRLRIALYASLSVVPLLHQGRAVAAPSLRVRANTRIEVAAHVHASPLRISGRLVDDRQQPLGRRVVLVHVETNSGAALARDEVLTSDEGVFDASLPLPDGAAQLRVVHEPDALYEGAHAIVPLVRSRSSVQLTLTVPNPIRLDEPRARIQIDARSSARAANLRLQLEDEQGREVAEGHTDDDGLLSLNVDTARLGSPGAGKLTVRFAGDERRAPAKVERAVIRQHDTTLSLEARRSDATVVVRGTLRDARGPLARKAVGVFVNGAHLLTRLTGVDGSYEAATQLPDVDDAAHVVVARFESDMPGLAASVSNATTLPRSGPGAKRLLWLLVPLLAAALIVLGARRREAPDSRSPTSRRRPFDHVLTWGDRTGHRSLRTISGEIVDATLGTRIANATIELRDPHGRACKLLRAEHGRFRAEGLADGEHELRVLSEHHAAQRVRIAIPHAGEGVGMRFALVDLRRAALDAHKPIAERVFADRRVASTATVREAFARAHQTGHATPRLADLTSRVEHAAYAERAPSQLEVETVEELAEASLVDLDIVAQRRE